jgi:hypothetical protein
MLLLDFEELDEGQIVRPFDRVDVKDHGLFDLPPEKAFQGKSACHGVRVRVDDHRYRIFGGQDLEEPFAPFGDGDGFGKRMFHDCRHWIGLFKN